MVSRRLTSGRLILCLSRKSSRSTLEGSNHEGQCQCQEELLAEYGLASQSRRDARMALDTTLYADPQCLGLSPMFNFSANQV